MNIILHEPKKDREKDAGSIYGSKAQHKNNLPAINMGLLGGCFYIKKMDVFCK